ncbi:interleukin-18 [Bombina bombina]|uniref:interleukin-18 n=1 Tax=Bombina bombina TaxID=8345 RepID=UPI00235A4F06|nr:interleukin-18 [Bombina bombina]
MSSAGTAKSKQAATVPTNIEGNEVTPGSTKEQTGASSTVAVPQQPPRLDGSTAGQNIPSVNHVDCACTVEGEDQVDSYRLNSQTKPKPSCIKNFKHQLIFAFPEREEAPFDISARDEKRSHFFLYKYREAGRFHSGLAVLFTVIVDGRNYLLYCGNDEKLHFKEGERPVSIMSERSEFIFYQKAFSSGTSSFRFESSMKPDYYLAFQEEDNKQKLVLKYCPQGVFNEAIKLIII